MPIVMFCAVCKEETQYNYLVSHINGRNNAHIFVEGTVHGDKKEVLCKDCLIKSIENGYIEE